MILRIQILNQIDLLIRIVKAIVMGIILPILSKRMSVRKAY